MRIDSKSIPKREAPSGPAPASLSALKPPPSMAALNADPSAHNRRLVQKWLGLKGWKATLLGASDIYFLWVGDWLWRWCWSAFPICLEDCHWNWTYDLCCSAEFQAKGVCGKPWIWRIPSRETPLKFRKSACKVAALCKTRRSRWLIPEDRCSMVLLTPAALWCRSGSLGATQVCFETFGLWEIMGGDLQNIWVKQRLTQQTAGFLVRVKTGSKRFVVDQNLSIAVFFAATSPWTCVLDDIFSTTSHTTNLETRYGRKHQDHDYLQHSISLSFKWNPAPLQLVALTHLRIGTSFKGSVLRSVPVYQMFLHQDEDVVIFCLPRLQQYPRYSTFQEVWLTSLLQEKLWPRW